MRHITQQRINKDLFTKTSIDEEYIIREMASKMVKEIPLDALKKLFKVEVYNPYVKQIVTDSFVINKLEMLRRNDEIEYKLTLKI